MPNAPWPTSETWCSIEPLAARTLQDMGYENVSHLDGGFNAWKESGKAID